MPDDAQNQAPEDTGGSNEKPEFKAPATQEDLDRIIETRLKQERRKFSDYDDLKARADELEKVKASQMSETEKAVQEARAEGEKAARDAFSDRLFSAEVDTLATRIGFRDAADALAHIGDRSDLLADGEPDRDAISSRLTDIASAKPYLVADEAPKVPTPPRPRKGQAPQDGEKKTSRGRAAAALRNYSTSR